MASTPVGTIKKYQQAIGIKKRNKYVQAWASPCARDVATIFWATWKDIEKRIPWDEDEDFSEADTPAKRRGAKNKYNAIVREAVRKHSSELQSVLEYYDYKAYLAGFVEQARRLGCLSRFMTLEHRRGSIQQESFSGLSESSFSVFGISPDGNYEIGVLTDDNGKMSYASHFIGGKGFNKWSNTNGIGTPINVDYGKSDVSYSGSYQNNVVRPTKQGGEKLPTAKTMAKQLGASPKTAPAVPSSVSGKGSSLSVASNAGTWVNVPNTRAQAYAKKHAAEAVTNIDNTTRKEIASIVQKGVDTGMSYGDIAKAINAKFEQFAVPMPQKHIANRGVLVAVTELANAYCQANYEVGEMLQNSGVQMMKIWSTMEDDRVSDGCRHNEEAGWIELDKPFPSGDQTPPRFPGCRCDFLQDLLEEDLLGRTVDDYFDRQDEEPIEAPVQPKQNAKRSTRKMTQRVKEKVKPAASDKKAKSRVPNWEKWKDLEDDFYDVSSYYNTEFSVRHAFTRGNKQDRHLLKNKRALELLRSSDLSFENMDEDSFLAIYSYTGDDYMKMNTYLRKGKGGKATRKMVETAKNAISKYGVTTEDMVVTRAFSGDYWSKWSEGEVRELPEFLSVSVVDYEESNLFEGDNVAHIYVPANKGNGIYTDGKSANPSECECIIIPGSKFKVHHIERNGRTRHFYLELIVQ